MQPTTPISAKKYWFRPKFFGAIWLPISREGWLVSSVYWIAVLFKFVTVDLNSPTVTDTFVGFFPTWLMLTLMFYAAAFIQGQPLAKPPQKNTP